MKNKIKSICTRSLVLFLAVLFSGSLGAQDLRGQLFPESDQLLKSARQARADILAPGNFGKAMEFYNKAEANLKKGRKLDDIKKELRAANAYFGKAIEATKLAEVTLISGIKARDAASNADAPNYAGDPWQKAESKFLEASKKLEDGDVNGARRRAQEAEKLFREAELAAIKANYLQETWDLLEQAEKKDVGDNAPKTLARAQSLVKEAEKELNENRYDTDVARNLAQQAKYEAKHALYLDNLVRDMKRNKKSTEDLVLESEMPLSEIASAMDMVAEFDRGYEPVTKMAVDYIRAYQDSAQQLSQMVDQQTQQIATYQERVSELESQLGDFAKAKSELHNKMEAQAKARARFAEVEKMFSRDEARVLREGNNVLIRLVGLNFASGKSTIEPQYFSMLTKVQNAIKLFPSSNLSIEGHTDSFGSDETNLRLSEQRAEAVKQYLLANMSQLKADNVVAVGYGESQPIANNETAEGRTKNRRIEVMIIPTLLGATE